MDKNTQSVIQSLLYMNKADPKETMRNRAVIGIVDTINELELLGQTTHEQMLYAALGYPSINLMDDEHAPMYVIRGHTLIATTGAEKFGLSPNKSYVAQDIYPSSKTIKVITDNAEVAYVPAYLFAYRDKTVKDGPKKKFNVSISKTMCRHFNYEVEAISAEEAMQITQDNIDAGSISEDGDLNFTMDEPDFDVKDDPSAYSVNDAFAVEE